MTTTEPRSRRAFTFPIDPTDEELARDWTLTAEDLAEVRRCRGNEKRHSFALQLCMLRRFGRFLGDDYSVVPVRITNHVGRQLGLPPVLLVTSPGREATDLEHERRLRDHLGFVSFDGDARARLETWLHERATEGLLAKELLGRAEEHLHEKRIMQPGRSVLERLVNSVAMQADEETLARIEARLSPALRTAIDGVLEVPEGDRHSMLFRFKEYPPSPTSDVMISYLKRAEHLRELGVGRIDFSGIRPDAILHLAQLARRYDVRELRRFAPTKRHPMVACFLAEANKSVLDHLVEMHHVFLTGLHRRAGHAFDKRHRELRQRSGRSLRLVLDTLEALLDPERLRRVIETHLPRIRVEDLLVEVDSWCGFTRELVPVGGYAPRLENPYKTLLAALVAHGTNLGIATMAQSTKGITIDMLQHTSRWFLRPETLKAANRVLVDYHHGLDLAGTWGDGTAASSDGQRFGVQESSLLAGFYPRYFGFYDRAITVYTHVSDQFSVFAGRAISCSPREAIYVLDGLLENDTILRPREHYTDTHGSTEQLFGLCYLLGFSFMPRLKDLADQQLYKLDRARSYGSIDGIFRSSIDVTLLREQWDPMVRVAASLRARTAPAHVVLDRLAASSPSDRLAKALTMLGRVVKTTHVLRYLHDAAVRDRVQLQLNRGESRHELARRLFFANQGAFRSGDYEEIMNKVSALSLLSNAVLVWNTVRFAEVVKGLESTTGAPVDRGHIARISPLAHAHVIPSGTYHFERASRLGAAE